MGVKFTPNAPKSSQSARIAELEKQVAELQAQNQANVEIINTLLGVSET